MEAFHAVGERLAPGELLTGLGLAFVLGRSISPSLVNGLNSMDFLSLPRKADIIKTSGIFSLFLLARTWLALVDKHVPEPYLVSCCPLRSTYLPIIGGH